LLASHPHIPSQQQEKDLGYDVELQIQQTFYIRSIFLQHKVAHHGFAKAGRNARFFDAHPGSGGCYYRFPVDTDQHNTLVRLGRRRGDAYYCAPRFLSRAQLERHFRADQIATESVWLDPTQVGVIGDADRHHVTYSPGGAPAYLHSDARSFERVYVPSSDLPPLKETAVSLDFVGSFSVELTELTAESKFAKLIPKRFDRLRPVQRIQYLLGQVYEVSWILLP